MYKMFWFANRWFVIFRIAREYFFKLLKKIDFNLVYFYYFHFRKLSIMNYTKLK